MRRTNDRLLSVGAADERLNFALHKAAGRFSAFDYELPLQD